MQISALLIRMNMFRQQIFRVSSPLQGVVRKAYTHFLFKLETKIKNL